MDRWQWNSIHVFRVVKWRGDWVLVAIPVMTTESKMRPLLNKLGVDLMKNVLRNNDRLQGTIDNIFGMVWITMLTLRLADLGNVGIIRALSEICILWVLLFYPSPAMYMHILATVSNAVNKCTYMLLLAFSLYEHPDYSLVHYILIEILALML